MICGHMWVFFFRPGYFYYIVIQGDFTALMGINVKAEGTQPSRKKKEKVDGHSTEDV